MSAAEARSVSATIRLVVSGDVRECVPSFVIDVHEPNAPARLNRRASAAACERGLVGVRSVEVGASLCSSCAGSSPRGPKSAIGTPSRVSGDPHRDLGTAHPSQPLAVSEEPTRSSESRWSLASTPGGLEISRIGSPWSVQPHAWSTPSARTRSTSWPHRLEIPLPVDITTESR